MCAETLTDRAVLAYLKAKRTALDQAIAALEGKGGDLDAVLSGGYVTRDVQPDSFVGMNIATASVKYLGMVGRPARTTEDIYSAIVKGGLSHFTRGSVATILQRIHNKGGEIAKVSKGVWGLSEWYPNRPKPMKKKNQEETRDKTKTTDDTKEKQTKSKGKKEKARSAEVESREGHTINTIALRWLEAVRVGGTEGLTTQQLATGIGYESGRSLPFIALKINKRLVDLKMDPKTVYEGKKVGKEHRWFPKEKLQEALKALRP